MDEIKTITEDINTNDFLKLGKRLKVIAEFIPVGSFLGDIGTDHAYLPVYLAQKERIARAIGVDIHKGPFLSAKKTVSEYKLSDKIEIRLGDGLKPLDMGEVNVLSIAGMGGSTILDILRSKPEVVAKVEDLILQPQGAEAKLRQNLTAQGWRIVDETLVEEDNKIYTVIHFSKDKGLKAEDINAIIDFWAGKLAQKIAKGSDWEEYIKILSDFIWTYGPLNLKKSEGHLVALIDTSLKNTRKILAEMQKTDRENIKQKSSRMLKAKRVLEVIRTWVLQLD